MNFKQLLNIHGHMEWRDLNPLHPAQSLVFDSRQVTKGSVYVAIRGSQVDGHQFLDQAIAAGASVLVVEDSSLVDQGYRGGVLEALDTRLSLQALSQRFFGHPGDSMAAIAVTGTNGKTSSAYMIEHLLGLAGNRCGVLGTIDHHIGGVRFKTELTTPDPVTLQKRLQEFRDHGADSFVIEASSHALEQNRIHQGFEVCLFTNLSRDHLDYHQTMDAYFQSKAKLFASKMLKENTENFAVINRDDPYGEILCNQITRRKVFSYGQSEGCDLRFHVLSSSLDGSEVELNILGIGTVTFRVPLIGLHNVYNMVGSLGVLHSLGISVSSIANQICSFKGVPGRMQGLKSDSGIFGFVDYAHTPEALGQAISALKSQLEVPHQLICVFGCGGDRDSGKRAMMGQVAFETCDQVIVTSDNPRSEDPLAIIKQIVGRHTDKHILQEPDRSRAISQAVNLAKPGDVILVAGKGHEDYQIIGNQKNRLVTIISYKRVLKMSETFPFHLDFVVQATQGKAISSPVREFKTYSIDNRADEIAETLFIPLVGDNHDAHTYVAGAIEKGATGVLFHKWNPEWDSLKQEATFIEVSDTLIALQHLASAWRKKLKAKVIAVTGSNGKTTTKDFLSQILSEQGKTTASRGSYNNHWGVPFTLLETELDADFCVTEMGMNHPGEITSLNQIATPDVVAVTNVGRAHVGNFTDGIEGIASAKKEIYDSAPKGASLVFNIDNSWTRKMYEEYANGPAFTFSTANFSADVYFKIKSKLKKGFEIEGQIGGVINKSQINFWGEHNLENLAAAVALAYVSGVSPEKLWKSLPLCHTGWGRNQWVELQSNAQLLFDGYNANPDSFSQLLANLSDTWDDSNRYVGIFGEMLELGDHAESEHFQLGQKAARLPWEHCLFVGPSGDAFAKGWATEKTDKSPIILDSYKESLALDLNSMVDKQSLVIVKGSRGGALERFVERLQPLHFSSKK